MVLTLQSFSWQKDMKFCGIIRRTSQINTGRIDPFIERLTNHYGDLTDSSNLIRIIKEVQPDEIYNLGAQSSCEGIL